jgi:hypothetical protein
MGFFYRTIRIVENGIKPAYVFDGKPPDLKSGVVRAFLVLLGYTFTQCRVSSWLNDSKSEKKPKRKERRRRRPVCFRALPQGEGMLSVTRYCGGH